MSDTYWLIKALDCLLWCRLFPEVVLDIKSQIKQCLEFLFFNFGFILQNCYKKQEGGLSASVLPKQFHISIILKIGVEGF